MKIKASTITIIALAAVVVGIVAYYFISKKKANTAKTPGPEMTPSPLLSGSAAIIGTPLPTPTPTPVPVLTAPTPTATPIISATPVSFTPISTPTPPPAPTPLAMPPAPTATTSYTPVSNTISNGNTNALPVYSGGGGAVAVGPAPNTLAPDSGTTLLSFFLGKS